MASKSDRKKYSNPSLYITRLIGYFNATISDMSKIIEYLPEYRELLDLERWGALWLRTETSEKATDPAYAFGEAVSFIAAGLSRIKQHKSKFKPEFYNMIESDINKVNTWAMLLRDSKGTLFEVPEDNKSTEKG